MEKSFNQPPQVGGREQEEHSADLTVSEQALGKIKDAFNELDEFFGEMVSKYGKQMLTGLVLMGGTIGAHAEKPALTDEQMLDLRKDFQEWRYEKPKQILENEQKIIKYAEAIKATKDTMIGNEHHITKRFKLSPKTAIRIEYVNGVPQLFAVKNSDMMKVQKDNKMTEVERVTVVYDGSTDGSAEIDGVADRVLTTIDGKEVLSYSYGEKDGENGNKVVYISGMSVAKYSDEFSSNTGVGSRNIIGTQKVFDRTMTAAVEKIESN